MKKTSLDTVEKLTEEIKSYARKAGADLVGIAPVERYEGAPSDMHPKVLLPAVKSVIVIANRMSRGALLAIDNGNRSSYNCYGYGGLCEIMRRILYDNMRFLEDRGFTAVPIDPLHSLMTETPAKTISLRAAAFLAGLGEFGFSKVFLTPQFGPRQRFGLLLTDAELKGDPLFEGKICDRCMLCIKNCPGNALNKNKIISQKINGKTFEYADINEAKCSYQHYGMDQSRYPFIPEKVPFNESWTYADVAREMHRMIRDKEVFFYQRFWNEFGTYAMCGARGCVRTCLKHLEEKGIIPKYDSGITVSPEKKYPSPDTNWLFRV